MITRFFSTVLALTLACALSSPAFAASKSKQKPPRAKTVKTAMGKAYGSRADVMRLADDIAERRELDKAWVRRAIGQARYIPRISQLMAPAPRGTPKNWGAYRSRFIDNKRIQAGVEFWKANRETLRRAEADYGVPAAIIVGIIGVETIYGQQMGSFRVLDALTTLSFDFPAGHPRAAERSEFFKGELERLLSLTYRSSIDPLSLRGSYAGAMGLPQFMPSSWARYAVDFDGDGKVDLFNTPADAIGSVANYLKTFGWQNGMPTHYPVSFDSSRLDLDGLLLPDILPTFSVASFQTKGAMLHGPALEHKGPLALVELQNGNAAPSYVAGTENFYTVTRYNWSSYYALAVIELGREVESALEN